MKKTILRNSLFTLACSTLLLSASVHAEIANITVFGSISPHFSKNYHSPAYQFGKILGQQKKTLIYNGSIYGLLGDVYKGATDGKTEIINISMPDIYNEQCPENHPCRENNALLVDTVQECQSQLYENADMIVVLPGGVETLDAFTGYIIAVGNGEQEKKPVVFLNINHYWDNLRYQLDEMKRQNELGDEDTDFISFTDKPRNVFSEASKLKKQIEKNKSLATQKKITLPTQKGTLTIHY